MEPTYRQHGWLAAVQKGQTVPVETLTFRSLTVVSDNEVDLIFDADDSGTVTFRFAVNETANGLTVTNGPPAFVEDYRQVPGPAISTWPEQLAVAAWRARRDPLPAGRRLELLKQSSRRTSKPKSG